MKSRWLTFVIPGLWVGALAGSIVGGSEVSSQHYLQQRLWLNALRVLAPAMWAQVATALIIFVTVWVVACVSGSFRRGNELVAALTILLAAWVATSSLWLRPTTRFGGYVLAADLVLAAGVLLLSRRWSPTRSTPLATPPLALLIVVTVGHWGLDAARGQAAREQNRPNVLVLLVDALRADHVGAYGYRRPTTPAIDRLAAQSALFRHTMSPSNTTRTSMPSIWTGLVPSRHGVFLRGSVFRPRFITAAELLREAGYRTGAWCPNPSLDRSFGQSQGWDVYDDEFQVESEERDRSRPLWEQQETASRIHARFLAWIDRDPGRPFLAWLHYRDAHAPYVPPPPYDQLFRPETHRPLTPDERSRAGSDIRLPADDNNLEYYVARYDGEIRYVDDRIGEMLQELERRGLREQTVIVVTADHGEGFLEHGSWNHGASLYEELLHVPLIIVVPGGLPVAVDRLVSSIDLFPTILDLAGVDAPPNEGLSLLPLVRGQADGYARTQAFAMAWGKKRASKTGEPEKEVSKSGVRKRLPSGEGASATGGARLRSVRQDDWKLIVDRRTGKRELYDLSTDPAERINRFDSDPEVARKLLDSLDAIMAGADDTPAPTVEISPELSERLESLGYTQ